MYSQLYRCNCRAAGGCTGCTGGSVLADNSHNEYARKTDSLFPPARSARPPILGTYRAISSRYRAKNHRTAPGYAPKRRTPFLANNTHCEMGLHDISNNSDGAAGDDNPYADPSMRDGRGVSRVSTPPPDISRSRYDKSARETKEKILSPGRPVKGRPRRAPRRRPPRSGH